MYEHDLTAIEKHKKTCPKIRNGDGKIVGASRYVESETTYSRHARMNDGNALSNSDLVRLYYGAKYLLPRSDHRVLESESSGYQQRDGKSAAAGIHLGAVWSPDRKCAGH